MAATGQKKAKNGIVVDNEIVVDEGEVEAVQAMAGAIVGQIDSATVESAVSTEQAIPEAGKSKATRVRRSAPDEHQMRDAEPKSALEDKNSAVTEDSEEAIAAERAAVQTEAPAAKVNQDAEQQAGDTEPSKTQRIITLAAAASSCVRCDLAQGRTHVVFGDGNPEAPLMIIGEGPGQNEDATGRPFVGRAGVLLDACLKENGISRKHIYITNVVRCRPKLVEAGRVTNRPPTPEEVKACSYWLEETIAVIDPLVILCLGAPSSNAIIHKGFKMTQERGQWFESRFARYAMASWHPAYILRLQGEAYDAARASLVSDIAAARQKVIEAKKEVKLSLF